MRRHKNPKQSMVVSIISKLPQEEEHTNTNQETQDLREEEEKILLTWEAIQKFTMSPL